MRRGLTADVVVRTGADLADEVGFDAVTLAAVARRLDVRTPSLYSHVAGSDDLAARICALALEELADVVSAAVAGRSGGAAVLGLLDAHGEYARRHPGRYAATRLRLPAEGSTGGAGVEAALAAGRRHADLLRALLRGYDVPSGDEVHVIRLLGSVVLGFATLDLAGAFAHSEPPSQESRRFIAEALDAMLRPGGAA